MTNRLAQAQSLYLRKHAENPIDWWPWCDAAIDTARQQDKPIFLSIGYSSCHWCTVMEGEAFSNETIADYMNANFLPIKVDREERPDLDSIYMQALQMMTEQGGWPLNVFLTPDTLVPFYGGTYFPLEPRYGRPAFLQILQSLRHYYDTQKTELQTRQGKMLGYLQQSATLAATETLSQDLLQTGLDYSAGILSSRSYGTSFPMIPYAEAALRSSRFPTPSRYDARQLCTQRGLDLALGGIFDHVGGGFHRYTVDATWTVPHFEKMLYDNGQIVEFLANLWSAGVQEPAFERAIDLTAQWLIREMTAPEGYFYASQDADSFTHVAAKEPEEGAFYVWSYPELESLLSAPALTELTEAFTVSAQGNFERQIVLQRRSLGKLSDSLEATLAQLFQARYGVESSALTTFPPARDNQEAKTYPWTGRIPAVTDTKMIVAWNSLMISGLARAAIVFQQPTYLALAAQAIEFILQHQWVDDRFHRLNYDGHASVLAQSEDYALLIKALLDLHQASQFAPRYLEQALRVQAEFDDLWSVELGGYYNTDRHDHLLVRERSYADNATPSANGIAIANLVRLSLLTENLEYLDRAEQALKAFGSIMEKSPQACPSLFSALDWFRNQTLVRTTSAQIAPLLTQFLPTVACVPTPNLPAGAVALVCQGLSCKSPALSEVQLQEQLAQSQIRGA